MSVTTAPYIIYTCPLFLSTHHRPTDQRYRYPSSQCSHQLRLPQNLRDVPSQNRPIGSLWSPWPGNQPHHARRPIQSSHDRKGATDRDTTSTKGHRQETLRCRIPDRNYRRTAAVAPDHAHWPHPCLVGIFVDRHLRSGGPRASVLTAKGYHVTFLNSFSPSLLSLSLCQSLHSNLNLKCTYHFTIRTHNPPILLPITSFISFFLLREHFLWERPRL